MNPFFEKLQGIGQKATQIKQAIASVPPRIEEARSTVFATAGQLQQLREDVQSTVMSLRTEDQNRLLASLREIDASADIFREAGYVLQNVEMEISFVCRLVVQLKKVADVPHESMKVLVLENESRKTVHAILTALIKAEEMSDGVNLTQLAYRRLSVYVGPTPSVRLCWSTEAEAEPTAATATVLTAPTSAPVPVAAPTPTVQPATATSSFFGPRKPLTQASQAVSATESSPAAIASVAPATSAAQPASTPAPAAPSDWRKDALARFKKMPDLTKRS